MQFSFFQGDKPWDMCKEVFNWGFFQTFKWLRLTMPVGACNNVFRRISTGLNTMGARHSNSRCRTSSESELSRFTFVIKKNNEWNHLYTSINEMKGINRTVFSLLQSSLCSQAGKYNFTIKIQTIGWYECVMCEEAKHQINVWITEIHMHITCIA